MNNKYKLFSFIFGTAGIVLIGLFFILQSKYNLFIVEFDTNGGSFISIQKVAKDKMATEPMNPTKDGYKFIEWQLDNEKYNFKTKVTKDIILKAKWEEDINYIVTFDSNGGSSVPSQTIKKGEIVIKPANPIKDGYTFVEWLLNSTSYDFSKTVTENITLVASYTKKASSTPKPTVKPTATPTTKPTVVPTAKPTTKPTVVPTTKPTTKPTVISTVKPTVVPTAKPTPTPTPKEANYRITSITGIGQSYNHYSIGRSSTIYNTCRLNNFTASIKKPYSTSTELKIDYTYSMTKTYENTKYGALGCIAKYSIYDSDNNVISTGRLSMDVELNETGKKNSTAYIGISGTDYRIVIKEYQ